MVGPARLWDLRSDKWPDTQRADITHVGLLTLCPLYGSSERPAYMWGTQKTSLGQSTCVSAAVGESCDSCACWSGKLYDRGVSDLYS